MRSIRKLCPILLGLGICALAALAQTPGTFMPTGSMGTARFFHTATLLYDGRVLIAGGDSDGNSGATRAFQTLSSAELYDPSTGTFTATGKMTTPRGGHLAALLPDGRVLIAGGGVSSGSGSLASPALASAELYDPSTGTFSSLPDMTTARFAAIATVLQNGKVLIVGGADTVGLSNSAEIYDPSTGTFTATGNMTTDWADTATLLPSGQVLITRGNPEGPPPYLSSADLYDPSTGTFSFAGYMNMNHTGPTATLLPNGQVLVAGGDIGDGDGPTGAAELYDPVASAFAFAGSLIVGREQNTATLLPGGTVLMAGGHNNPVLAATAEIYDPVKETSSNEVGMTGPRELHRATLLNDGRVLITGGDGEQSGAPEVILASAELFCLANANCPQDSWQQAIVAMKTAAGSDSLNFWQWAWYWQNTSAFSGAPGSFGVSGSISPNLMSTIIAAGGGDPNANVSAEQWVGYFRQVSP